ncbi:MAG: hypothetical protein HQL51_04620 [Magnetococcales bacterium]|nr:hypothetical protein [Magnetococcales bacterium]
MGDIFKKSTRFGLHQVCITTTDANIHKNLNLHKFSMICPGAKVFPASKQESWAGPKWVLVFNSPSSEALDYLIKNLRRKHGKWWISGIEISIDFPATSKKQAKEDTEVLRRHILYSWERVKSIHVENSSNSYTCGVNSAESCFSSIEDDGSSTEDDTLYYGYDSDEQLVSYPKKESEESKLYFPHIELRLSGSGTIRSKLGVKNLKDLKHPYLLQSYAMRKIRFVKEVTIDSISSALAGSPVRRERVLKSIQDINAKQKPFTKQVVVPASVSRYPNFVLSVLRENRMHKSVIDSIFEVDKKIAYKVWSNTIFYQNNERVTTHEIGKPGRPNDAVYDVPIDAILAVNAELTRAEVAVILMRDYGIEVKPDALKKIFRRLHYKAERKIE